MGDRQVILSVFEDEAAADAAVDALKAWDEARDEIKLTAIGILALDEEGTIKAQKLGKRSVGKGAGIGIVLALLTPVGVGAVLAGGVLGAFHHKGLGLSDEDRARIGKELEGGKAAVGVLAAPAQATLIAAKLTELGGTTESHDVTDEALEAAAVSVEVAPEPAPVPTA